MVFDKWGRGGRVFSADTLSGPGTLQAIAHSNKQPSEKHQATGHYLPGEGWVDFETPDLTEYLFFEKLHVSVRLPKGQQGRPRTSRCR